MGQFKIFFNGNPLLRMSTIPCFCESQELGAKGLSAKEALTALPDKTLVAAEEVAKGQSLVEFANEFANL